jgi:hypothetical protein
MPEGGPGDFAYTLTNQPDPKDWQRDLYLQKKRFCIAQAFHQVKSQTGMCRISSAKLARLAPRHGVRVSGRASHE